MSHVSAGQGTAEPLPLPHCHTVGHDPACACMQPAVQVNDRYEFPDVLDLEQDKYYAPGADR